MSLGIIAFLFNDALSYLTSFCLNVICNNTNFFRSLAGSLIPDEKKECRFNCCRGYNFYLAGLLNLGKLLAILVFNKIKKNTWIATQTRVATKNNFSSDKKSCQIKNPFQK